MSADYLFDPVVLDAIQDTKRLSDCLTLIDMSRFKLRPLKSNDYERFSAMSQCRDTYFIVVLEDLTTNRIAAAGTLLVELKFIRQCNKRGHIEDVIVGSDYRGMKLGSVILQALTELAWRQGCYKLTLDCKTDKVGFYEKNDFFQSACAMRQLRPQPSPNGSSSAT